MFLETVATQCTLVKILFGTASPLFKDLDELYRACQMAHRDSILNAIRFKQPDWFAHVFWAVTCQSKAFFTKALQNNKIGNGKMLQRPMMDLVRAIIVFNKFCQHNTPPELLPGNEQTQTGTKKMVNIITIIETTTTMATMEMAAMAATTTITMASQTNDNGRRAAPNTNAIPTPTINHRHKSTSPSKKSQHLSHTTIAGRGKNGTTTPPSNQHPRLNMCKGVVLGRMCGPTV